MRRWLPLFVSLALTAVNLPGEPVLAAEQTDTEPEAVDAESPLAATDGFNEASSSALPRLEGTLVVPLAPSAAPPLREAEPWERPFVWVGTAGMVGVIIGLLGLATRMQGSAGGTGGTNATGGTASGASGLGALPIGPYAEPMMLWGLGLGLPLYLSGAVLSASREDAERRRATGLPGDDR
ncbi:MAG: hypothetical protein VKO64_02990 [Candidatus Sericytochromatia bacterium]|nr:hypothetical protein [Candidatus Sericytochromatia bacterium]